MSLGVTHFSTAIRNLLPTFGRWDEDYRLSGADWQLFIPSSCGELAPPYTVDMRPPLWRPCLQADVHFIRLAGSSLVRPRNTISACEPGRIIYCFSTRKRDLWWILMIPVKVWISGGRSQNQKHAAMLKLTVESSLIKNFCTWRVKPSGWVLISDKICLQLWCI